MGESKIFHGNDAFVFPSITVYEDESGKKLEALKEWKKRKIIINKKLDSNFQVIVTDDGGICPIIENNRSDPVDFLNVLFATMTILDYPAYHMKTRDFSSYTWNENEEVVQMNQCYVTQSIRSQLEVKRDEKSTFNDWLMHSRKPISKQLMEKILDLSYQFYHDDELKDDVILIGETFGMYFDDMYKSSFLYSWMIIENFLERIWRNHVDTLFKSSSIENKILKEFVRQTSDNYIKMFTELAKIDTKGCQALHKLRQIRNDIIHERYSPNREETFECILISRTILINRIQNKNPFEGIELKKIKP